MLSDSPRARDGVIARIRNSTAARLWIVTTIAVAIFLAMRYWGIARDCGPREHDGLCEMSASAGQLSGAVGAIVFWLGASAYVLSARRRRERRLRIRRLHGDDFVDPMVDRGAALLQNRLDDDRRRDARGG